MFPIFCEMFSEETMIKLYSIMEEEVYAPNQLIFNSNSNLANDNIYLIIKGSVNMYIERGDIDDGKNNHQPNQPKNDQGDNNKKSLQSKKKKDIVTLKDGQSFGIYSFLTGTDKVVNTITKQYTQMIKIQRKQFIDVVKQNKEDYEKFMQLKDKLLFDKNIKAAKKIECYACKSTDHIFSDCNKVQFDKNNSYIIFRHLRNVEQVRDNTFKRPDLKNLNPLSNLRNLGYQINNFQEMNDFGSSSEDFLDVSQSFHYYNSQQSENYDEDEDDDAEKAKMKADGKSMSSSNLSGHSQKSNTNTHHHTNNNNPTSYYMGQASSEFIVESAQQLKQQVNFFDKVRKERQTISYNPSSSGQGIISSDMYIHQPMSMLVNGEPNANANSNNKDDKLEQELFRSTTPQRPKRQSIDQGGRKVKSKKGKIDKKYPFSPQFSKSDEMLNQQFALSREISLQQQQSEQHASAKMIGSMQKMKRRESLKQPQKSDQNLFSSKKQESRQQQAQQYSSTHQLDQQNAQNQPYPKVDSRMNPYLQSVEQQILRDQPRQSILKQRQSILFNPLFFQNRIESAQFIEGPDKDQFFWKFDKQQDYGNYFVYYNLQNVLKRWFNNYYIKINKKNKKLKLRHTQSQRTLIYQQQQLPQDKLILNTQQQNK